MGFSISRATICSDVRPSGTVSWCWMTLPSTSVSTTSRRLACRLNWYSPDLRSSRALSAMTPPTKTHQGWLITPSRVNSSAMSRLPVPRGMLTNLSWASGPGCSKRCLPNTTAPPAASPTTRMMVNSALPATTIGLRARRERRRQRHLLGLQRGARTPRSNSFHLHERYTGSIELAPGDGRIWDPLQPAPPARTRVGRPAIRANALYPIRAPTALFLTGSQPKGGGSSSAGIRDARDH